MKKDIKSAAIIESEAQTLETDKAASVARDVHKVSASNITFMYPSIYVTYVM